MSLNVGELAEQKTEPFVKTCFLLLVVRHGVLPVQRAEADLRVNLERPLLALWRYCVIHLLNLALSGNVNNASINGGFRSDDFSVRSAG